MTELPPSSTTSCSPATAPSIGQHLAFCLQGTPAVHRSNYQITGNVGVVGAPLPNDPMVRAAYVDNLDGDRTTSSVFSMLWPHRSGAPAYASPQAPVTTQCSTINGVEEHLRDTAELDARSRSRRAADPPADGSTDWCSRELPCGRQNCLAGVREACSRATCTRVSRGVRRQAYLAFSGKRTTLSRIAIPFAWAKKNAPVEPSSLTALFAMSWLLLDHERAPVGAAAGEDPDRVRRSPPSCGSRRSECRRRRRPHPLSASQKLTAAPVTFPMMRMDRVVCHVHWARRRTATARPRRSRWTGW